MGLWSTHVRVSFHGQIDVSNALDGPAASDAFERREFGEPPPIIAYVHVGVVGKDPVGAEALWRILPLDSSCFVMIDSRPYPFGRQM